MEFTVYIIKKEFQGKADVGGGVEGGGEVFKHAHCPELVSEHLRIFSVVFVHDLTDGTSEYLAAEIQLGGGGGGHKT